MESSNITLEEVAQMITAGSYWPVTAMIRGYPYRVKTVFRRSGEIFVLMKHNFIDVVRLIQLPQGSHEAFKRLLTIIRTNNVEQFYLEYVGDTEDEEPILHAYGRGVSTYV
jgi:hypothetical protein